jgi:hypothetical protein
MSFLFKTLIGVYILSVLFFSSQSQALDITNIFTAKGTVYEFNGYLLFEDQNKKSTMIHSNSFEHFEKKELPLEVEITGVTIKTTSSFNQSQELIQIIKNKIMK